MTDKPTHIVAYLSAETQLEMLREILDTESLTELLLLFRQGPEKFNWQRDCIPNDYNTKTVVVQQDGDEGWIMMIPEAPCKPKPRGFKP